MVPNPSPMTYSVVATTARKVNAVKGRPLDQEVAVSLHDAAEWSHVVPSLDIPAATLGGVIGLLSRRLSVLLPLRRGTTFPGWVAPAVRDEQLAAFNGSWSPTAAIWRRFPRLFGSSANRTGQAPAATAAQASDALGGECQVIDGDGLHASSVRHAASTLVRVDRNGYLTLRRTGAQDQAWTGPLDYTAHLATVVGLRVADTGTGAR